MAAEKSAYSGPVILAGGYRVFFPLAALWAVASLLVWISFLYLEQELGFNIDMFQWHAHSLVFGYGGAVVAGFALTAIPNWTGRSPVRGWGLVVLVLPWLGARFVEILLLVDYDLELIRFGSEMIFYVLFLTVAAREVLLGKNWRNLKIVVVFGLLTASALAANLVRLNLIDLSFSGPVLGLSVLLLLITIIGGRIIPAFTANWLRGKGKTDLPVMFNRFDGVAIVVAAGVLAAFLAGAEGLIFAAACGLAALLHFARLARWKGVHTTTSPIVFVLHVSYLWVPIGFVLMGASSLGLLPQNAAVHAWAVGGIGSTTLAVMSRASLGHAGLPLADSALLSSIYAAINLAALLRITAFFWLGHYNLLVQLSALFWCVAFLLSLWRFIPLVFAKRQS